MKITVDLNICQDHGQCVFAAPEVFTLDEDGHLAYVEAPDESLRADAEDAADVCPLQAIRVEG
ncbi:ferredoxin [Streptomyces sp. MZ04]|uniref:ferredoxin n=1 Tax=Streptomyces sp. MZ04 TaxID=2559236 RepID=UPI00107EDC52|nr:ferredoxin [Streptomyces sp. MZ04]TGB09803.1 ferredoxin [Streptomyces sp. MZ04]